MIFQVFLLIAVIYTAINCAVVGIDVHVDEHIDHLCLDRIRYFRLDVRLGVVAVRLEMGDQADRMLGIIILCKALDQQVHRVGVQGDRQCRLARARHLHAGGFPHQDVLGILRFADNFDPVLTRLAVRPVNCQLGVDKIIVAGQ